MSLLISFGPSQVPVNITVRSVILSNVQLIFSVSGTSFVEWLSCDMDANDIIKPPSHYPSLSFRPTSSTARDRGYYSIRAVKTQLLHDMPIKTLGIMKYHIVLRASRSVLPHLGTTDTTVSGKSFLNHRIFNCLGFSFIPASHLCDCKGCLRSEHLTIEPFISANLPRKKCDGVMLIVRDASIIRFDPCMHGINHPDANGDSLRFSCRKLRLVSLNSQAIRYIDSVPRS